MTAAYSRCSGEIIFIASSFRCVEFGEFVRKNTPSTGNEAARENVQGVKDWFLKDYVKSKGDWSIIYNAFYAAPVATISNAVVDTAKKMFHANPEAALAMPINNVESGIPNETMFEHPENYRIAKFTWIQDGVIPKQAITANRNQMNSTEPFERARGARQLDRFLRDPEIPTHLKDEAMKIISPEQREYAAVINSLDGDFPQIDRLKELHESPINRKDGAANWDAWSDPKKWDSKKSLATFLDDNNYVSDKDQISPAALNAFETSVKSQVESGLHGNGDDAFANAQTAGFSAFQSQWGDI